MSTKVNIYAVKNYAELIEQLFIGLGAKRGLKKPGRVTVREACELLDQKSTATMHAIMSGRRLLSPAVQKAMAEQLKWSAHEAKFVSLWVSYERKRRTGRATDRDKERLESANLGKSNLETLSPESFSFIADWFHFPLKSLLSVPDARANIEWIEKKLRCRVSSQQIMFALQNMQTLGLISREKKGWVVNKDVTTPQDIPSEGVRRHHVQMMERAMDAIREDEMSKRDMSSLTFTMDPEQMTEAKQVLEEYRLDFLRRFEKKGVADCQVMQLNFQFFQHTK
jgi:uncharacterized protein (TIGR02147 family)